jgi:hypothetical protein
MDKNERMSRCFSLPLFVRFSWQTQVTCPWLQYSFHLSGSTVSVPTSYTLNSPSFLFLSKILVMNGQRGWHNRRPLQLDTIRPILLLFTVRPFQSILWISLTSIEMAGSTHNAPPFLSLSSQIIHLEDSLGSVSFFWGIFSLVGCEIRYLPPSSMNSPLAFKSRSWIHG